MKTMQIASVATKGGHGDLLRAVEDRLLQRFPHREVSMDVFDLDRGIIDEDANGEREAAEGHDVDRIAERAEQRDRGEDRERNRDQHDERAAPRTEEEQDSRCP
jgi:hypothetical protein